VDNRGGKIGAEGDGQIAPGSGFPKPQKGWSKMTATPVTASSVGDLRTLVESWQVSLAAQGKSPNTISVYIPSVRHLIAFLSDSGMPTAASRITREHIEMFIADQLEQHKPATASVRYRSLDQFFKWAQDEGEVRDNPMRNMRPPRVPEDPVPVICEDDLGALLAACAGTWLEDRRDAAMIRFFIDTGCRLGEVTKLRLEDVDVKTMTATVKGKGSRTRTVAFTAKTAEAISRYMRVRQRQRLHTNNPRLWVGRKGPMSESGIQQIVSRRAEQAGIAHIHPHQFRHTAAHRWLANGGNETDLMTLNGWRSRQMVSRYAASAASQRAIEAYRRQYGG
jgi:site-specific recombinase XerD